MNLFTNSTASSSTSSSSANVLQEAQVIDPFECATVLPANPSPPQLTNIPNSAFDYGSLGAQFEFTPASHMTQNASNSQRALATKGHRRSELFLDETYYRSFDTPTQELSTPSYNPTLVDIGSINSDLGSTSSLLFDACYSEDWTQSNDQPIPPHSAASWPTLDDYSAFGLGAQNSATARHLQQHHFEDLQGGPTTSPSVSYTHSYQFPFNYTPAVRYTPFIQSASSSDMVLPDDGLVVGHTSPPVERDQRNDDTLNRTGPHRVIRLEPSSGPQRSTGKKRESARKAANSRQPRPKRKAVIHEENQAHFMDILDNHLTEYRVPHRLVCRLQAGSTMTGTIRADSMTASSHTTCGKEFSDITSFMEHMVSYPVEQSAVPNHGIPEGHCKSGMFECAWEGCKHTGQVADYLRHLCRCHCLEWQCPIKGCGKRYARPDTLKTHLKTHGVDANGLIEAFGKYFFTVPKKDAIRRQVENE